MDAVKSFFYTNLNPVKFWQEGNAGKLKAAMSVLFYATIIPFIATAIGVGIYHCLTGRVSKENIPAPGPKVNNIAVQKLDVCKNNNGAEPILNNKSAPTGIVPQNQQIIQAKLAVEKCKVKIEEKNQESRQKMEEKIQESLQKMEEKRQETLQKSAEGKQKIAELIEKAPKKEEISEKVLPLQPTLVHPQEKKPEPVVPVPMPKRSSDLRQEIESSRKNLLEQVKRREEIAKESQKQFNLTKAECDKNMAEIDAQIKLALETT